jgi:hypothetical protein
MGAKHDNCEALEEVACGIICKQLGMEVMTLEEWEELQKKKKHRKKEKTDGVETISDIEDGEDGNVCLKQFYVEILLGSTATALSSLIRPC